MPSAYPQKQQNWEKRFASIPESIKNSSLGTLEKIPFEPIKVGGGKEN